jgi:hypothetical protein
VRPKFDLSGLLGTPAPSEVPRDLDRARHRRQLWDELFAVDNVVGDDGWFIDDVRIEQALSAPITLAVDNASFAGLPCPACTSATAASQRLAVAAARRPGPARDAPGLGPRRSTRCNGGTVQYQFWIDGNL